MAFTTIAPAALAVDEPITSAIMLALYNNPIETANAGAGAPPIVAAALNSGTNSLSASLGSGANTTVTLTGYSFFPSVSGAGLTVTLGTGGTTADDPQIRMDNPSGSPITYTIRWRSIT